MTDTDVPPLDDHAGPYSEEAGTCVGNQPLNWAGRCQPMNEGTCPGGDPICTLNP